MVRTLGLFVAALAASCVYAAPLEARRHKHHKSAQAAVATTGVAAAGVAAGAAGAAAALIDANTTPGEAFTSPDFEGEEAGLQLKIQLESEAGEDAEAAADQDALDQLNQDAGGGI
ncbi:hypothetical protein MVEN_01584200 [Mycena venus]|uniref:Uncharacterized protein n=1 Tax=Mycena venus TaxID=2733690 RepID=A0A8H6XS88_9AGAR|nr:hypothetical protein MVEN_01584200 [Mycena venus]